MPTHRAEDPNFEARVRDSFARQPAMALIGARLVTVRAGMVEIELPRSAPVTQQHGFVHGGIVGMIADSAAGYAAFSLFPVDTAPLTVEYKINLLAPADGDRLVAQGRAIRSGRTLTICQFDVTAYNGEQATICATGLATIMRMVGRPDTPRAVAAASTACLK